MKTFLQDSQENSPKFSQSKKPQKSETELLLEECGEVLAKLKKKKLGEREFLCELIKLMAFSIPQIPYEIWLEKCIESGDVEALNDLVFQYARNELLPGCEGGYDQCERLIHSFLALACGDMSGAKNVMTHSMPPSTNGYRFLCVMSDLVSALLWDDKKSLEPTLKKARRFADSKKPINEREAVKFILALHEKDAAAMSESLSNFCVKVARTAAPQFEKRISFFAHGLYALAHYLLPFEIFERICLPKAKNFNENYAKRLFGGEPAQPKLYFSFPPEFDVFNQILNAPPAKTVLYQPFDGPSLSDQIRFLDHDAMVENLADEILKAGTLNQNL